MSDQSTEVAPLARWSSRLAVFSVSLVVVGVALHRLTSFPTPVALNLFAVGAGGALLAVLVGLVAAIRIWRRGTPGAASVAVGILLPVLMAAWPLTYLPAFLNLPPINDVSTDTQAPPRFVALAEQRPREANRSEYPAGFAQAQEKAYPDLRPVVVDRGVEEAFELVEDTVRKLKWRVAAVNPPAGKGATAGTLEATDVTPIVGFVDDIAIRVEGAGTRSRIDVRSASRFGRSDLGQNALRVRRFLIELQARVDSTGPVSVAGRRGARARALVKKVKERDPEKAESRSKRGRAQSNAQRERGQKETLR
jgi:uncharacterized protein (DUF1499 family)